VRVSGVGDADDGGPDCRAGKDRGSRYRCSAGQWSGEMSGQLAQSGKNRQAGQASFPAPVRLAQSPTSTEEENLGRAAREVEVFRDVGYVPALDLMQYERLTIAVLEIRKRGGSHCPFFAGLNLFERRFHRRGKRGHVFVRQGKHLDPAVAPVPVNREIMRDTKEPAPKRSACLEGIDLGDRPHEGFLAEIVRVCRVSHPRQTESVQGLGMAAQQQVDRPIGAVPVASE
jgi:hypothetical protein